jgi:pantoate--beta-alanine ligase
MNTLLIHESEAGLRMQTVYDLDGLRQIIGHWKREGLRIAFVPTMGNLHGGHMSLLERARELADRTVVSVFVNPIQFGKGEDYERYPSTLKEDSDKLAANGLDLFGEKDYQQLLVIRRMVRDLCLPVDIVGMPVVREADGLAMSSRNAYLTSEQRSRAPAIYRTLQALAAKLRSAVDADLPALEEEGMQALEAGGLRPEYFSIRRTEDLGEPGPGDTQLSILAAAWLGSARLIDNVKVVLKP